MTLQTVTPPPPRSAAVLQGQLFTQLWSGWFRSLYNTVSANFSALGGGISTTVELAALTATGTKGSLTVVNGVITAYTAPT